MQAIQDIFSCWPSIPEMANALSEKPDTVLRWKLRGRIPEHAWPKLIELTAAIGNPITAEKLLSLNSPIQKGGWPAGKSRKPKVVSLRPKPGKQGRRAQ